MQLFKGFTKSLLTIVICMLISKCGLMGQNKPQGIIQTPASSTSPTIHNPYPEGIKTNYVRVWEPVGAYSDPNQIMTEGYQHVHQATQYVDGLGRSLQAVQKQSSPAALDVVTPILYDPFGREDFKYPSYVQTSGSGGITNDGNFKSDPFGGLRTFYQNDYKDANNQLMLPGEQFFYSRSNFEPSPLNRIEKTLAPGNSWVGNNVGVEQKYFLNTAADAVRVWNISFNSLTYINEDIIVNIPSSPGSYSEGQLYKNVTKNEQGKAVVEYKDKGGRVLLKKVQIGTIPADFSGYDNWLSTYYVYDDLGQLRFVIPPKAVDAIRGSWLFTNDIINELCFRYEYDGRERMIAKKTPGAGWTYMIYDIRDRLVFTQDAKMRIDNKWLVTLYDEMNRTVVKGIMVYNSNPSTLQQTVNTLTAPPSNPNTSLQVDKILNANPTSGTEQAMRSITMIDGFESGLDFTAEINPGPGGSNGETTVIEGVEVNKNPIPSGASFVGLSVTFYDNYNFTNTAYTTVYNGNLNAGTNLHAEAIPATATAQLRGVATGGKVRVLEDPANISSGRWLTTVSFYDEKGRVIQTNSENFSNGTDIHTSLYDFSGSVLSSYIAHRNPLSSTSETRIRTDFSYDHFGRLLEVWKVINDDNAKKALIARNSYDALGNLLKKELGKKKNIDGSYTATPLEILDYTYNIRGWLKGINAGYSHPELSGASTESTRFFGFELSYDWGFDQNQLNGSIGGIRWRSKGDGEQRAYGLYYDDAKRLLRADFTQNNSGWNTSAGIDFSVKMGDGINFTTAYDPNGNIIQMQQWGLKVSGSSQIDNLSYTYQPSSNKLSKVFDAVTTNNKLGDFYDGSNGNNTDYAYDVNGNLTLDNNKAISSITYSHLDMPFEVTFTGKGTISYIYDAGGNKLRKTVRDNTISPSKTTTIDYINGFIYENNNLQFVSQEEGRIRAKYNDAGTGVAGFEYDYFIKDHLNNVRMVLTEELKQDLYPAATLEGDINNSSTAVGFEKGFYTTEAAKIVNQTEATDITSYQNNNGIANPYPSGNSGNAIVNNNSEKLYKLTAGGSNGVTGLGITLRVMSGDKIDILGKSYYSQNVSGIDNVAIPVNDIISGLFGTPGSPAGNKATPSDILVQSSLTTPVTNFLNDGNRGAGVVPKAFVNYILFDENFKFVAGNFSRVGSNGIVKSHYDDGSMRDIPVTRNGYLYVYVSNESPVNVFFDNLQVVHTRGPILEETHYYPFGLTMFGISSEALQFGLKNKNKFNGYEKQSGEFSDGVGLDWYDYKNRFFDNQTGRFFCIDRLSDQYVYYSPYQFAGNEVPNAIDLDGLEPYKPYNSPGSYPPIAGYKTYTTGGLVAQSYTIKAEGKFVAVQRILTNETATDGVGMLHFGTQYYFVGDPTSKNCLNTFSNDGQHQFLTSGSNWFFWQTNHGLSRAMQARNSAATVAGLAPLSGAALPYIMPAVSIGASWAAPYASSFARTGYSYFSQYLRTALQGQFAARLGSAGADAVMQYAGNIPQQGWGWNNIANINGTSTLFNFVAPNSSIISPLMGSLFETKIGGYNGVGSGNKTFSEIFVQTVLGTAGNFMGNKLGSLFQNKANGGTFLNTFVGNVLGNSVSNTSQNIVEKTNNQ